MNLKEFEPAVTDAAGESKNVTQLQAPQVEKIGEVYFDVVEEAQAAQRLASELAEELMEARAAAWAAWAEADHAGRGDLRPEPRHADRAAFSEGAGNAGQHAADADRGRRRLEAHRADCHAGQRAGSAVDADGDASAEKMNEKEDEESEKQLGLQCAWVGGSPGGGGAVGARSDSDTEGERERQRTEIIARIWQRVGRRSRRHPHPQADEMRSFASESAEAHCMGSAQGSAWTTSSTTASSCSWGCERVPSSCGSLDPRGGPRLGAGGPQPLFPSSHPSSAGERLSWLRR